MGFLGDLCKSFLTAGLYDPYQRDIPEQHGGRRKSNQSQEEADHKRKMEQGELQEKYEEQK